MHMLRRFSLPLLLAFSALLLAACGSNGGQSRAYMEGIETSERYGPIDNSVIIRSHDVTVYQRSDRTALIGNGIPICLRVQSNCSSAHVRVISTFDEEEADFVKSEPEATVEDGRVIWEWDYMRANDCEDLTLWLAPKKGGDLVICTSLQVLPTGCVCVSCGTPELTISKKGPEQVILGCEAQYEIAVKNVGTLMAEDVCLKDFVPEGLSHNSGKQVIGYRIGNLAPGEESCVPLTFCAIKKGSWCNRAVAESANTPEVSAEACTKVIAHEIAIYKTGAQSQYVGKDAEYQIVVSNPGDEPLTGVVVTDNAPKGTVIKNAPDAEVCGNQAVWHIGDLAAGESRTLSLSLCGDCPCRTCNTAEVCCNEGCTDLASAHTDWKGASALSLEIESCESPLMLGCETSWKIKVVNTGTAGDNNVHLSVSFPPGLQPKEVNGPSMGAIDGQRVIFDPLSAIECEGCYEWTVSTRAVSLGEQNVKAEMKSDTHQKPTVKETNLKVY